jgi:hypothetical protein
MSTYIQGPNRDIDVQCIPAIHSIAACYFADSIRKRLPTQQSVYYIGKIDFEHKRLAQILDYTQGICDVHIYGVGVDVPRLVQWSHAMYHGSCDSVIETLREHKIYISMSETEGVCTATGEALAMNKHVILVRSQCNDCFAGSTNVRYVEPGDKIGFQRTLRDLLTMRAKYEKNIDYMRDHAAGSTFMEYLSTVV